MTYSLDSALLTVCRCSGTGRKICCRKLRLRHPVCSLLQQQRKPEQSNFVAAKLLSPSRICGDKSEVAAKLCLAATNVHTLSPQTRTLQRGNVVAASLGLWRRPSMIADSHRSLPPSPSPTLLSSTLSSPIRSLPPPPAKAEAFLFLLHPSNPDGPYLTGIQSPLSSSFVGEISPAVRRGVQKLV